MSPPHNPFGVLTFLHWNHDWNNFHFRQEMLDRALSQLEDLGVGFIRVDILWSDIHQGFQQYDFSRYDELMSKIQRHNLSILAVLQYNKIDRNNGVEVWNSPPESFEEFSAYVGATVARYKNQIKHWEIWNEPNLPVYWNAPKDNLSSYCRLLSLSRAEAKKSDPTCVILNGGFTEPIVDDVAHFYQNGGHSLSDIVNLHTFLDPLNPHSEDRFDQLIQGTEIVMDSHGDQNKKIWITEMGCPGVPDDKMNLTWFGGKAVNENGQADWLEKQIQLVRKYPRIEKLFWAFYRDTENEFKDATDYLGLVRLDLSPKPSFYRLKEIIASSSRRKSSSADPSSGGPGSRL